MAVSIRTGRVVVLSAAGFAIVAAAGLAQHDPTPEITRELRILLAPWHRLIEVGEKLAEGSVTWHV